jgi:hypothetical protein
MIFETLLQMKKMLGQLDGWLEKAVAYAKAKPFDPNVLFVARLAPDQFAFARQVQAACDAPRVAAARLAGREPASQPDVEKTIEELRARIQATIAGLDAYAAKDFAGAEERTISNPRWEGKVMRGADYFLEHTVPNFFFHLVTAYAILRHNGVDVGKRDYLGALSLRTP